MFSSKPNYSKLRTNLRLCINRLKFLEKKKTELALKSRAEIAEFIKNGKLDRARIRVESIIREDYLVEAMEIVEMYCDMLLARFGLIERITELDPGIEEGVATILWATPRLVSDIPEFKEISNQLALKYSKEFAEACRKNGLQNVNEKVISKLTISAPPKLLVENYMIEISKTYKVPFEPDPANLLEEEVPNTDDLIQLTGEETKPPLPTEEAVADTFKHNVYPLDQPCDKPFNYPQPVQPPYPMYGGYPYASPFTLPSQPPEYVSKPPPDSDVGPGFPQNPVLPQGAAFPHNPGAPQSAGAPHPAPRGNLTKQMTWDDTELPVLPDVPTFPDIPTSSEPAKGSGGDDTIDFDDLNRRFEELKKKK